MRVRYSFNFGGDDGEIEVDSSVIDHVDDDWRASLYPLHTEEEIVAHIARNMIVNGYRLTQMDGWADMDDSLATIVVHPRWPAVDDVERVAVV